MSDPWVTCFEAQKGAERRIKAEAADAAAAEKVREARVLKEEIISAYAEKHGQAALEAELAIINEELRQEDLAINNT